MGIWSALAGHQHRTASEVREQQNANMRDDMRNGTMTHGAQQTTLADVKARRK